MCRPPCCNQSGGQGTGIAAGAVIIGAALVAAKIGPILARIVHTAIKVICFAALTTGLVVAVAVFTWAVIVLARWQLRRKAVAGTRTRVVTMRPWEQTVSAGRFGCLGCGGTGTVLRALRGGRYQPGECPVCEPIARAG
jgi:hypothetical protein